MEKPQFWILKNEKGRAFSLKTCTQEIKIPENTVEKVFALFFDVFKDFQSKRGKKLNLYLGVKPRNKKNESEVKFFVSPHEGAFYRSKNSGWRFFMIPLSNRIKEIKVDFQKEPKVLFRFEV